MVYGCLCCLLAACTASEEVQPTEEAEQVNATFQLSTRAVTVPASEVNEGVIRTIRVYAFRQGKVEGYYYTDNLNVTTHSFQMTVPSDYLQFYFIVNEQEAGTLKTDNQAAFTGFPEPTQKLDGTYDFTGMTLTADDLKALTFTQLPQATLKSGSPTGLDETGKEYLSPYLPMTAVVAPSYRMSNNLPPIEVKLLRSVGKLTFRFSKTGQGDLFMGRGMYLYNVPQFGYLFPKTVAELTDAGFATRHPDFIGRKEADACPNPVPQGEEAFYNDSRLHQLNGVSVLANGWKDEPDNYQPETHGHPTELDINKITEYINDPDKPDADSYNRIPNKSFYIFANPHEISANGSQTDFVNKPDAAAQGYYVKILGHEHLMVDGQTTYKREKFYVHFPRVEANEHITVNSIFSLDGHTSIFPNWVVKEWVSVGGDIEFN